MGTNFYLNAYLFVDEQYQENRLCPCCDKPDIFVMDFMDPKIHIGKRSSAGFYCWDCNQTLCIQGVDAIHHHWSEFSDKCLHCGQKPTKTKAIPKAIDIELGFEKPIEIKPRGVTSCCSFSWAQPIENAQNFLSKHLADVVVVDEYGDFFTGQDFLTMLEFNCPIQSTKWVNTFFG